MPHGRDETEFADIRRLVFASSFRWNPGNPGLYWHANGGAIQSGIQKSRS